MVPRLLACISLCGALLLVPGCSGYDFSRYYNTDASSEQNVSLDPRSIVGEWGRLRGSESHDTLEINEDGTAYMGTFPNDTPVTLEPYHCTWKLLGSTLELTFEDGHTESLAVDWVKPHSFQAAVEGTSTYLQSGTWARRRQ